MQNNILLTGSLSFIGLADIFQILGGNSSTGVLKITSQYSPYPGMIYFMKGNPINSTCGSLKGIKAIYALFGWVEGIFEFRQEEIDIQPLIKQGRMEIVLDALRKFDDGEIKKVGPPTLDEISLDKETVTSEGKGLPVIKGHLLDYSHVLKEEYFKKGDTIVTEGSHGKWMWVIYEGVVKVTRDTPNGPVELARLGEGSFIGTFKSLLFGEYIRNASVTAENEVRLCLLDSENLYTEYTSLSSDFRNVLMSLDGRLRKMNDRIVEFYSKENKSNDILKNKKVVFKKGSTKEDLFIIREGQAHVVGQSQNIQVPLLILEKNDTFGNIQFLDFSHEPRSASVLATDELKTDKLNVSALQQEYDRLSVTFKNLIFHLNSCISVATSLVLHLQSNR